MADLFTRTEVDFGGAMHAQFGLLVPNNGLTGALMQNLQIQYSQQVTRLYEIGRIGQKSRVYYISGRAQGQIQAAHVIGPGVVIKAYYDNYGDVCQAINNQIQLQLGPNICGGAANALTYRARHCVLTQIGLSVAAQDFVISENSTLMFAGLELNPGNVNELQPRRMPPAAN
jgi:hypothetical protein